MFRKRISMAKTLGKLFMLHFELPLDQGRLNALGIEIAVSAASRRIVVVVHVLISGTGNNIAVTSSGLFGAVAAVVPLGDQSV